MSFSHDSGLVGGPRALGLVPTEGRGSMPFALLGGEPLVTYAALAASAAGIRLVDFNVGFDRVRGSSLPLALHDPLCPLTSGEFLRRAIRIAEEDDIVVVGVQPVTDTIKTAADGVVGATVDRDALWAVTSPVVLPPSVVAELEDWPDSDDFAGLVAGLRDRFGVHFLEAPSLGRRVEDESALAVLEALADERRHTEIAGADAEGSEPSRS